MYQKSPNFANSGRIITFLLNKIICIVITGYDGSSKVSSEIVGTELFIGPMPFLMPSQQNTDRKASVIGKVPLSKYTKHPQLN